MGRGDSGEGDAQAQSDLIGLCFANFPLLESPLKAIFLLFLSDNAIIICVKELFHLVGCVLSAIGLLVLEADGGGETEEAEGGDGFHCLGRL